MKKYLSIFACFVLLLMSSCTNDEIPVGKAITFTINPGTVVQGLYEIDPGELTSIKNDEKLYVSLYVYNTDGALVCSDTQKLSSYSEKMITTLGLEYGNYTLVAVTRIIKDNGTNFWEISDTDRLYNLTITNTGSIGLGSKILGLSTQKITVEESTQSIYMDVKIAGAVAAVKFENWNGNQNISIYGIATNKKSESISLNENGDLIPSIVTFDDLRFVFFATTYKPTMTGDHGYQFMFPCENAKMSFATFKLNNERFQLTSYLGENETMSFERGHSYLFTYDVASKKATWEDMTKQTRTEGEDMKYQDSIYVVNGLEYNSAERSIKIAQ